jgi:uncharacterized membrane protein
LYLQMEPLFALCLCGVPLPSRGDCRPLGWILVRLVGCMSLHALQSELYKLAWAVILAIGWTITGLLTVIIIGLLLIPVMIVLSVVPFVHMAYAAYKVNQGVDYRYPFVADLIGGSRRSGTL